MIDLTPLLHVYAKRRSARLAAEDAIAMQKTQLLRLVRRAAGTRFGRAHDFAQITSVETFQVHMPVRSYEDFWREWWRPNFPKLADITWPGPIPYFAISSGTTTGTSKLIPVSPAMIRANERAALDILVHHLSHRPKSRVLGGRTFMVGGSANLKQEAAGIYSGDLSGIVA